MNKKTLFVCLVIASAFFSTGCANDAQLKPVVLEQAVVVADYAPCGITLDGKLDEAVWQGAEVYQTNLSLDRQDNGDSVIEGGTVRFAWDDTNLYVAIDFVDSDVVAEGTEDQLHHYQFGDLAEVFVKPVDQSWYWELYATPRGNKTTFFFPSKGLLGLPSCFEYQFKKDQLQVAAQINGTLNDYSDRDTNWTAEFVIPISELTSRGEKFGPGTEWTIFVGRYNYSYYLKAAELSMAPALPATSYHLTDNYAKLVLKR